MADRTDSAAVTRDAAMGVGTTHAGFVVTRALDVPELRGTAYVMRHEATGARLMWIANDDTNRSFSIAFKTPPTNDTGVFHILEHSVLCGSDRFPVKEPFVNLLKTSMQTFLNALTFPDKTMYPVASTNERDLLNLMDVYLDAVLHPAIYHRPRIFQQEGWHYEISDEKDGEVELTRNGVVLNEMKGAFSDPDEVLMEALNRDLFPDTAYRWESGGDPRHIPELTYEEFVDTHARHYRLDNSYTILYGDLDIERVLAFVGERFDGATDRGAGAPNELALQACVEAAPREVEMPTDPKNACVGMGLVVGRAGQRERLLACDNLFDALMGSNEAPLTRAILASGMGRDATSYLMDGLAQPYILIQLKGNGRGAAADFERLVRDECARLASEGIGGELLEASLAQAEFNLREGDNGYYADGVAAAINSLNSWLYDDDDPTGGLRYEEALASLRAHVEAGDGWFENLLREVVCDSAHHALVEVVPTADDDSAAERAELASILTGLDDDARDAVRADVEALRAEQEAPDAPEDLAKLPSLGIDDIGPMAADPACHEMAGTCAPCLVHEVPSNHIDYVYAFFDLGVVAYEDMPYVSTMCTLLGSLGTAAHSASELDTLTEKNLGSLTFHVTCYATHDDPDSAHAALVVGTSALAEKVGSCATIPAEIWSSTDFDDRDRVRDLLQQKLVGREQTFMGAGHVCALSRVASYFSRSDLLAEKVSGVDDYLFLRELLDDFDARFEGLVAKLAELSRTIFSAGNVWVSFTGTDDEAAAFWEAAGDLSLAPAVADDARDLLRVPDPTIKNEAFAVPGTTAFVAAGSNGTAAGIERDGAWQVAGRVLQLDYLWNEVRVKGGAYGCGFGLNRLGLARYYSYRDPNVDATVERFDAAGDWLAEWDPDADELAGYVVSTVAGMDAPAKARAVTRRQNAERLADTPADYRERTRAEALATTVEQARQKGRALTGLAASRGLCAFGGKALLEGSELGLHVIELMADDDTEPDTDDGEL